mmetsp:Transcript_7963/g.23590  ORF Transcript_7963/g.23590 Transcript_7963/m.23590 type:complete len:287 (-) Transcript_7963:168-1028(-)
MLFRPCGIKKLLVWDCSVRDISTWTHAQNGSLEGVAGSIFGNRRSTWFDRHVFCHLSFRVSFLLRWEQHLRRWRCRFDYRILRCHGLLPHFLRPCSVQHLPAQAHPIIGINQSHTSAAPLPVCPAILLYLLTSLGLPTCGRGDPSSALHALQPLVLLHYVRGNFRAFQEVLPLPVPDGLVDQADGCGERGGPRVLRSVEHIGSVRRWGAGHQLGRDAVDAPDARAAGLGDIGIASAVIVRAGAEICHAADMEGINLQLPPEEAHQPCQVLIVLGVEKEHPAASARP